MSPIHLPLFVVAALTLGTSTHAGQAKARTTSGSKSASRQTAENGDRRLGVVRVGKSGIRQRPRSNVGIYFQVRQGDYLVIVGEKGSYYTVLLESAPRHGYVPKQHVKLVDVKYIDPNLDDEKKRLDERVKELEKENQALRSELERVKKELSSFKARELERKS